MRVGIDLDDVVAVCAVPYLREFARHFGVPLPDKDVGWHHLERLGVPPEERDRFRLALYDSHFFSGLDVYEDAPETIERMVAAGHEVFFITARGEKRRMVTETWLREKGLIEHAKAVHLRPMIDMNANRPIVRGRYDAQGSAIYKARLARELRLDRFCEDDETISQVLAGEGVPVWLFDHPWNRHVEHPLIDRVRGWSDVAGALGLA